jgi:NodT family efflux transporter outer membrane factor (OMF) lipoprotein
VLIGKAPADFAIEPAALDFSVPVVPSDLPSTLLERNPTIAQAERSMAAANAQIGVAVAGYFPTVTLGGSYGQSSSFLRKLFTAGSSLWSFGLTDVTLPIFTGGLTSAQVAAARATYDQTVALYRQTVLTAFQQVEDQLAALRILAQQAEVQTRAVQAAQEAERLTLNQYRAGTVDYTAVVTAQANSLSNQQTALSILQSRFVASVSLVEALGGGWDAARLPDRGQVETSSTR